MQGFKHRLNQDVWLGAPNHKSHAMMSTEIFERITFFETKISQIRRSEALGWFDT